VSSAQRNARTQSAGAANAAHDQRGRGQDRPRLDAATLAAAVERPPTPVTTPAPASVAGHPHPTPKTHHSVGAPSTESVARHSEIARSTQGVAHHSPSAQSVGRTRHALGAAPAQGVGLGDLAAARARVAELNGKTAAASEKIEIKEEGKPTQTVAADMRGVWSAIVEAYRDRPIAFVEDLLVGAYPDFRVQKWQKRFLKAVARGERKISVRAGHGVGKSAVCSWALIWHMVTRYPQKAVLTAPTQSQLFDALFSEVKKWVNELPKFIRDLFEVYSDRIELKASPENSFMSARTSSAERPEALAGVHSEHVLLVVDEASGVPEAVFEAASGSMSGFTATTILISNPTRNTGMFFKTHHQLASSWFRMHVSCIGNPLVTPDYIREQAETYGETSSAYYVRVLGEFAPREDDVLIPAELVDAAMGRDVVLDTSEPLLYGLDVARFGDDRTVLCKRQGNVVIEVRAWSGADLMQTVGRVMHEADADKPAEIMVDSIGLGAGVADRLREQGLNVRDVNVAEVSALNPQAAKLRDELWMTLKDWLAKRSCRLPKDDELRGELVGPTYTFLSNGKLKVESKIDMKKRGLRSPDKGDSLCLTFAGAGALVGGRASFWVKGKPLQRNIRGVV